jgi:hypothetical protein
MRWNDKQQKIATPQIRCRVFPDILVRFDAVASFHFKALSTELLFEIANIIRRAGDCRPVVQTTDP